MKFLRNVPSTTSTRSEFLFDRKPDTLTKCETFSKYVFNREDQTACNRTLTSWCFLLVFYLSFLLACWGLLCLMVFCATKAIDYFTNGTLYDLGEIKHPKAE